MYQLSSDSKRSKQQHIAMSKSTILRRTALVQVKALFAWLVLEARRVLASLQMSSSRGPTIAASVTEPRSVSLSTASKLIQQVTVDWFLEFRNALAASMTGGLHGISTEAAGPWEVITFQLLNVDIVVWPLLVPPAPWTAPGKEWGFTTLRPNKTFLTKQGWFTTPFFNI